MMEKKAKEEEDIRARNRRSGAKRADIGRQWRGWKTYFENVKPRAAFAAGVLRG